jgi:drug/metabolite transporter (DMT)-like permease
MSMAESALALALASASVHAAWNLLLARARDPEAATAVALLTSVIVFAPAAAATWRLESEAWPYIAVSAGLQLTYFCLLAGAYARAELSVVYPIARGMAPVVVLVVGVLALGAATSAPQVAGVLLVGAGVIAIRGIGRVAAGRGVVFGLVIACCIGAYTLVDKRGIQHAGTITYLELTMVPPALVYAAAFAARRGHSALRGELNAGAVLAGLGGFGAYLLVLLALQRASAASVAAVRETSVVIAAALAAPALGERVGRARLGGAALVVVGIALLALD